MKKSELVEKIAAEAGISKKTAGKALDTVLESIKGAVSRGDTVTIARFGSFKAAARAARAGKNPRTGESFKIAATSVPKFAASASFKAKVGGYPTGGGGPGKKR